MSSSNSPTGTTPSTTSRTDDESPRRHLREYSCDTLTGRDHATGGRTCGKPMCVEERFWGQVACVEERSLKRSRAPPHTRRSPPPIVVGAHSPLIAATIPRNAAVMHSGEESPRPTKTRPPRFCGDLVRHMFRGLHRPPPPLLSRKGSVRWRRPSRSGPSDRCCRSAPWAAADPSAPGGCCHGGSGRPPGAREALRARKVDP